MALDPIAGHVYWTEFGTDKIQRANLDGSNVEDLVTVGLDTTRGIDLDLEHGKMYWTDRGTDKIQRANLDGSNIETLATLTPPVGDGAVHGISLDVYRGKMYWVDNGTVRLQRANLDGTQIETLLSGSPHLSAPWEIELDTRSIAGDVNRDGAATIGDVARLTEYFGAGRR